MNPERWVKPAIGQGAIQKRLATVKIEINLLTEQITVCAGINNGLNYTSYKSYILLEKQKIIRQIWVLH